MTAPAVGDEPGRKEIYSPLQAFFEIAPYKSIEISPARDERK
jgi:hypothetical protein